MGEFIRVDDNTRDKCSMDVARVLIRTNYFDLFNRVERVSINGDIFNIKVIEEWFGPIYWHELREDISSDSKTECSMEDFPTLFNGEEVDGKYVDVQGDEAATSFAAGEGHD